MRHDREKHHAEAGADSGISIPRLHLVEPPFRNLSEPSPTSGTVDFNCVVCPRGEGEFLRGSGRTIVSNVSPVVTLYWRPGCLFCVRLRRGLRRRSIPLNEVNIWEDRVAGLTVRSLTGGDETVPTVTIAGAVLVNPTVRQVLVEIRLRAPGLLPGPHVRHGTWLGATEGFVRVLARLGFGDRADS